MMISMNTIRNWECSQLVINAPFLGDKVHVHNSLFPYGKAKQHLIVAPKINKIRCLSTIAPPTSDAKPERLKREDITRTYFDSAFSKWKSQNLRARLPQYGRNGAHLENRLFSDIFSKGHTIVYRCATMNSKRDAKEIEDELLGTFDYAWNKIRNGYRRPDDIHKKLESRSGFSCLVNMILRYFDRTRTRVPFIPKKIQEDSGIGRLGGEGVMRRIFGTRKQRPREIGHGGYSNEKNCMNNNICSVGRSCGHVCDKPLVNGRKQCKPNLLGFFRKWFS